MSSPNSAEVSGSPSPAPSSIGNNAPKYGTLVPNRIFVGGISASTTEQDLLELFSQYGTVKATKIISDRAGVSKGYGFVTFETEDEARRLTQEADNIMLKDRKLNIAPAIKKQVSDVGYMKTYSPRLVESNNSMVGAGGTVFFGNGAAYTTYGNTVPVIGPAEYHPTFTQAPAAAPPAPSAYQTFVYQQPMYYTQQYQYQPTQQTVQPQWGAAPQWRWVTPASYPQPECSSPCLVEPSSIAQRDHTTTAVGSTPYVLTQHILTAPSISSNTTSTTTSTTVTTTPPCATVSTSSMSNISTTVCDSLLLIKPLTVNGRPAPINGKSKSHSSSLGPKTVKTVDDNNNSSEGNTACGSASSSTAHVSRSVSSDLHPSSNGISKGTSGKLTATIGSSNNIHATHAKVTRNGNGIYYKAKEESAGAVSRREQKSIQNTNRTQVETFSDSIMYSSLPPDFGQVVETSCNSNNKIHGSELTTNVNGNQLTQNIPSGVSFGMYPRLRHESSCPHHSGEVMQVPSSVVPQQMSPLIMVPSWTSLNNPATSSPLYDFTSKPIGCNNYHAARSQVSLPPAPIQPRSVSHTALPSEICTATQTCAVITSTKDITTCVMGGTRTTNGTTFITTTNATLVSTTNTVSTNTRSICSPVNNHSSYTYRQNPCLSTYPGTTAGASQTMYGYANQNVWMMYPYQYWRAEAPCYQWPNVLLTQWPVPPSPYYYGTTTINSTPPTYSESISFSEMPSEPPSTGYNFSNTFQSKEWKSEESNSNFCHLKPCDHRGNISNSRENDNGANSKFVMHIPPPVSSSRIKCGEQCVQKKLIKGPRMSKPNSQQNFRLSPCKTLPSSLRNPVSMVSTSLSHPAPIITEVDDFTSPTQFDDGSGLMPMTPPPTPVFKTDSSATIVSDTNIC